MRRIPSSIQGAVFAPVLICLFFLLKAFCPESAGNGCFADQFAVPIFLPLVAIYKIFGDSSIIAGHEFLLVMVYWAIIGFLVGLVVDLWRNKESAPLAEPPSRPQVSKVQTPAPLKESKVVRPVTPPVPQSIPVIKPVTKPTVLYPEALVVKPPADLLGRK